MNVAAFYFLRFYTIVSWIWISLDDPVILILLFLFVFRIIYVSHLICMCFFFSNFMRLNKNIAFWSHMTSQQENVLYLLEVGKQWFKIYIYIFFFCAIPSILKIFISLKHRSWWIGISLVDIQFGLIENS